MDTTTKTASKGPGQFDIRTKAFTISTIGKSEAQGLIERKNKNIKQQTRTIKYYLAHLRN